jgi:two-component system sensor histidine kinase ChiS
MYRIRLLIMLLLGCSLAIPAFGWEAAATGPLGGQQAGAQAGTQAGTQAGPQAGAGMRPMQGPPPLPEPGSIRRVMWDSYISVDSPLNADGTYSWTRRDSGANWSPMWAPGAEGTGTSFFTWLRTDLDVRGIEDPYLLVDGPGYEFEVFSGSSMIYRYGELNPDTDRLQPGNHPIFVSLGKHGTKGPLYLRIFTKDMTKRPGNITVGNQANLKMNMVRSDLLNIAAMLLFGGIGVFALLLHFINRDQPANLYFALFTLCMSLNLAHSLKSLSLFMDDISFSLYLAQPLQAAMIYFFMVYLVHVVPTRFAKVIRIISVWILAAGVLVTLLKWWIPSLFLEYAEAMLKLYELVFTGANVLCLLIVLSSIRSGLNSDVKWFVLGFTPLFIINVVGRPLRLVFDAFPGMIDFAPHEYVNFLHQSTSYAILFSIVFFAVVSLKRYKELYSSTKANARRLLDSNLELQKLDLLKDEFLANTSHELRTPLHGIIGLSESLIEGVAGNLPAAALHNIRMISASGKRLAYLVNDILDFSKLKHEGIQLHFKPVDLRSCTEVVLAMMGHLLQHKPVKMLNQLPSPCFVLADEDRLQQILYNLLGNAIKFTEQGTIEVNAVHIGGQWVIQVTDTGIGIPDEQSSRIFNSFVQADGSNSRGFGGTGLGLSITRKLVELHQGEISVQSVVGEGSTFFITLPAAEAPQDEPLSGMRLSFRETAVSDTESWTPPVTANLDSETTPSESEQHPGYSILIVDDEPVNLQVLANYMVSMPYKTRQASSAYAAIDMLEAGYKPDLIVLDVMMPRMSGYELCQWIREHVASKSQLPVLLLTAKNRDIDLVEGLHSGANDYMAKPVSKSELIARIDLHLQLSAWNQSLERKVAERTQAIRNLLDHAGQGFLSFDEQLCIHEEYSVECRRIFGREIAGEAIYSMIYPNGSEEQAFLRQLLVDIFQTDNETQQAVYFSLLPTELELSGIMTTLQYKWIKDEASIMVILTDISEQRMLEQRMEEERQVLKMVVRVVTFYRDFKDLIEDYRSFARTGLDSILNRPVLITEVWAEIFRQIHTFKGNFAQIDFMHIVDRLHEMESHLSQWKARLFDDPEDPFIAAIFKEWMTDFNLLQWLDDDLQVLRNVLGDRFDEAKETITIEKEKLYDLELKISSLLQELEASLVIKELKKLQYRPFRDLLSMYPEYVKKMTAEIGKKVYPVQIQGGDIQVDHDRFIEFTRTLIHVFRNMVDHGIEPVVERASVGKDPRGTISCEIMERNGFMEVAISNDGKIIDMSVLRRIALEREICTAMTFDSWPLSEKLMVIFDEQFTTRTEVTQLSGRGVGLSAVRQALNKLGGTIHVQTGPDNGTLFRFRFPVREGWQL